MGIPWCAVIVVRLTERSTESQLTFAGERVDIISACCTVLTWVRRTLVNIRLTPVASESSHAVTLVAAHHVDTRAAILTRS